MKTSRALLIACAALSFSLGANLQPQDMLFIGVHRNPTQIASDDRVAYVLTEGGVLLYDYRKQQWIDNIAPGMGVGNIAYNPSKSQLLMATAGGSILEYNPAFRRVSNSTYGLQGSSPAGTPPGDMNGLQLGVDFTYLPDASGNTVRDRWNRRASVTYSNVFDYDHLWVFTAGHGAFLGSMRRREASSIWFGLYDASATAVFADGRNVWFGSPNPAGALVRASGDLSSWRVDAAQQDYDFPDATIYDILSWRDYLWIATAKGVVRQDPKTGRFQLFRRMQGSTDMATYRLYVHQDRLFAGTTQGVAVLDDPEGHFRNSDLPIGVSPAGRDFCSKDQDLWAATSLGLFVLTREGWRSITDVTKQDAPDAYGTNVLTVGFRDTSLFWGAGDRVYEKPRKQMAKTLFEVPNVFRILFDGDVLYAGFSGGVRAYNLKTRLWTDFRLEDGIPGHKVQSLFVKDGLLWIGTDLGVMRLKTKSYLP